MKSGFVPEQNTEIFDVCLKIRYPEPERSVRDSGICSGAVPGLMDAVAFSAYICQTGGLDSRTSGELQHLPTRSGGFGGIEASAEVLIL